VIREGADIQLWALGPWVAEARSLAEELQEASGLSVGVVNARFAKPLDHELLRKQAASARLMVTFEDHVIQGGFGSAVLEALSDAGHGVPVLRIGYPDHFIDHGSGTGDLRARAGLDPATIRRRLRDAVAACGQCCRP
jgi:1-deoxy-D-xylulose-5-phosphate synthase